MKPLPAVAALALALLLAACGQNETAAPENRTSASAGNAAHVDPVYSASGRVTAIAGDRVTISHGPVEGLGWPAMTMTFRSGGPDMMEGIGTGDQIAFEFVEADGGYTLTSVAGAQ